MTETKPQRRWLIAGLSCYLLAALCFIAGCFFVILIFTIPSDPGKPSLWSKPAALWPMAISCLLIGHAFRSSQTEQH